MPGYYGARPDCDDYEETAHLDEEEERLADLAEKALVDDDARHALAQTEARSWAETSPAGLTLTTCGRCPGVLTAVQLGTKVSCLYCTESHERRAEGVGRAA